MNYKYDFYKVQILITSHIDDFVKNINQCKIPTDYKKVALLYKGNNNSRLRYICDVILFNKSIVEKIFIIVCKIEHRGLFLKRAMKKLQQMKEKGV